MSIKEFLLPLRTSSEKLALLNAGQKNKALLAVKKSLLARKASILAANEHDIMRAKEKGTKESVIDRLKLTEARISSILDSLDKIIIQTDPIGQSIAGWNTTEGLHINQIRVPLGVAAIIYESRPNVTVDAFALAYKSGNAILLRGSSSALESNREIVSAIKDGLRAESYDGSGIPDAIALADSGDHSDVDEILNAVGQIDVVLPRGGADLIKMVVSNSKIPVIETGSGICHLYVDNPADLTMAARIAENAKLQRPGVCNAIEVLCVHKDSAQEFLPLLYNTFQGRAELRCDERSYTILSAIQKQNEVEDNVANKHSKTNKNKACKLVPATESDFNTEFLDYILAIKVVDSIEEAISHINSHNTKHSESIITKNMDNAALFKSQIDAACVYVNASTRFTDGEIFGYGAELGISTQKMHIRGPMGLTALTTTKFLIEGNGQIR